MVAAAPNSHPFGEAESTAEFERPEVCCLHVLSNNAQRVRHFLSTDCRGLLSRAIKPRKSCREPIA